MKKVLVTGASGFIGRALCEQLVSQGFDLNNVARSPAKAYQDHAIKTVITEIDADTNWQQALQDCDVVIHLAARVHITRENEAGSLDDFRKVNVEGTANLARQAAKSGVQRFIFISSIKVNGEATVPMKPFTADDPPAPIDAYGISKREAEDALRSIGAETGMEIVIIRPPIVYGPGVKANFHALMCYLSKGIPLPFGAVNNKRSLLALDNLVDLIITTMTHPAAANQTFLASDGEDMSTTDLLRRMAAALNKKALLLPIPVWALKLIAMLLGKKTIAQKLCGSLQVDISKTQKLLGWYPSVNVDQALRKTAQQFKGSL